MAEETNNWFSQFDQAAPPIQSEEIKEVETENPVDTIDSTKATEDKNWFSEFKKSEEIEFADTQKTKPIKANTEEENWFSQFKDTEIEKSTIPTVDYGEPTLQEKIAYGLDKQNMFFGNVGRVAKAGFQAAFDPEREFKEVAVSNAKREKAALLERHQKFKGGKYDDDIEVLASEMATFLVDPYYIFMYMTPWGRAMSMRQTGIKSVAKFAGFSAGTVSLDKLFDNLATTGEVNPKDVATAGAFAGVLGPASMKAFQVIGKLLPGADKKKIAEVIGVIEGRTKKSLGVTDKEFRALQKIAGDKEFLKLNKQVSAAGKDWLQPIVQEQEKFYQSVLKIDKTILKLQEGKKLVKGKDKLAKKTKTNISKKITKIQKNLDLRQKEFDKAQTALWKKQSEASKKVIDASSKRDVKFLEKLWQQKSLTEKTAQVVLSASVRPLMGTAAGYGFGKLWGGDDVNLNRWMLVGASLGGIQKGIQASKIIPGQSKNLIQNLLYRDATAISFQKVRELTSTTTSSKLAAIGGNTEKIGLQLLEGIDSSLSKFSVTRRHDFLQREWQQRTANLVKPYSLDEQSKALALVRGSKQSETTRVKTLAKKIETELQDFKKLREDAGIFSLNEETGRLMDIKKYFPRVYNIDKIKADPKKFENTIIKIFKNLGKTDAEAKSSAFQFSKTLQTKDDKLIDSSIVQDIINGTGKSSSVLKKNPLSEHITKARILEGPYLKVEKVLKDEGYLVDTVDDVLNNLYNRSMKSIAFSEKFGSRGQMLKPYIEGIAKKYKDSGSANWRVQAENETNLIFNTIDGYFGRYGQIQNGTSRSVAGILSTISNLNMLDRVTIASLGDLVQSFQNSANFRSFFLGALRTGFTNKRETFLGKNLNQNLGNEVRSQLQKTSKTKIKSKSNAQAVLGEEAVLKIGDDATQAANVMGKMGTLRKVNEVGFKILGLQWLTGLARRYTYNVGAVDAYTSARKLAKYVSANSKASLDSSKGLKLVRDINRYGMNTQQALKLGTFNSLDDAVKNKAQRRILNEAGITAANRDALIPQVHNRLLFAQSRNPWVRLMGQFTSWAMAKSTQTNKILERIENGETKQLVKLLAALPVYGGIQMLREISKHGEVITDPSYNTDKWWAESLRLSGMSGILPELFVGRLTGPGADQPWFIPFPAASVAIDVGKIAQDTLAGDTDKATRRFWEKIAPFPTYRKWITELFGGRELIRKYKVPKSDNTILKPRTFNTGGEVTADTYDLSKNDKYIVGDGLNEVFNFKEEKIIKKDKKESKEMNVKDTVKAAVVAGALTTGVNAEVNKAQDNFILPKEKPKVEVVQKEKTKDYSKLPALAEDKKKFLIDSASVIYQNNKGRDVPDDILLAITLEETGYGTSRFYKEGNNYFNMVAEKGDDRIKAMGDNTQVAKFKEPSESLDKFYSWVDNKPHYKNVRATIEKYKAGEATKSDIIDEIAKTGWAENPNWSKNVKAILKARVNGKHSEELNNLKTSLFEEKE